MIRKIVSQDDLIIVGEHLIREGMYYVCGSYSIYIPSQDTKYMNGSVVRPWPNLDGELIEMLPGEAARTEIKRDYPDIKRLGWSGKSISLFDWRSPMHYSGPIPEQPLILVDLKSAYRSIYEKLWLDTSYPGGYYGKYPLYDIGQRLDQWKLARNALVGITRCRKTYAQRGSERIELSTTNKYLSPGLWASVQHTLHWVAGQALEAGAIYINTDGYIFPYDRQSRVERLRQTLSEVGLTLEIRAIGEGEITNWNAYKVGDTRTKPYRLGLKSNWKEFSNVEKVNIHQWQAYIANCHTIANPRGRVRCADTRKYEQTSLLETHAGD